MWNSMEDGWLMVHLPVTLLLHQEGNGALISYQWRTILPNSKFWLCEGWVMLLCD